MLNGIIIKKQPDSLPNLQRLLSSNSTLEVSSLNWESFSEFLVCDQPDVVFLDIDDRSEIEKKQYLNFLRKHKVNCVVLSENMKSAYMAIKHNVLDYLQLSIEQGIDAVYSIIGGTSLLTVDNLTRCNEVYYTEFNREFPEADTYLGKDVLKWLQEQDKEVLDECEEFTLYRIINETV